MDQHLEEKSSGSHPNKTEKRILHNGDHLRDLWSKSANINIPIFGVPERERERSKTREGAESLFKRNANNVPSLQRFLHIQVHKTHRLSNKINLDDFQDS